MTVKNLKLEDSLEQFVNGEILEGDNAYFCEKCNERVSLTYRYKFRSVSGNVVFEGKNTKQVALQAARDIAART